MKRQKYFLSVLMLAIIMLYSAAAFCGAGVKPTISINGVTDTLNITKEQPVKIAIGLSPGEHDGKEADWWLLRNSSGKWYYYNLNGNWIDLGAAPTLDIVRPTYQGRLFSAEPVTIFNLPQLASGNYSYYFGIDLKKNGLLDTDSLYYSGVNASVSETWYKDEDGDGYSDGTTLVSSVRPSAIYFKDTEVHTSGDLNDKDPNIHPEQKNKWVSFDLGNPALPTDEIDVKVITSTSKEFVVEYRFPGMDVSEIPEKGQIYQLLELDGCGESSKIGKPDVPLLQDYIAFPEGAGITAEIIDSTYRDIDGYNIYPVQEPEPDTETDLSDLPSPPFAIDTATYQTDAFYPSQIVQPSQESVIIRGASLNITGIYPVQFNPVAKKIRVYSYLKLKFTFTGGTRALRSNRYRSPAFDQILGRLVINSDILFSKSERAAYEPKNSLLIITHPNFKDAADTLKAWKIRKGILAEVRSTTETGSTAAEIQTYISNAYKTWNPPPTYILLIGDAEFIPCYYKTMHPSGPDQGRIGTDLYYTTVDGRDYFPDISLGRLSVDTADQANKRIRDIINYEKAIVTDSDFYKKAAICAEFQDVQEDRDPLDGRAARRFAQTSEDVALFLSDAKYSGKYSVDRIYRTQKGYDITPMYWSNRWFGGGPAGDQGAEIPAHLKKPGFAWDGDKTMISDAVNQGRFLVTHRDHGYRKGWSTPPFNANDVLNLTNGHMLPLVLSINCQTGWFDNETDDPSTETPEDEVNFSEAWERNTNGGAIGVIAASRVSYSGHNDRLIWGWMDAIWPDFVKEYSAAGTPFDKPLWEMGPILNYGKYYYAKEYDDSSTRKAEFEMFHWFGDPTMEIWTDVPQNLSVSYPGKISVGAKSVAVTVTGQSGALICVSKANQILAKAFSTADAPTNLSWSEASNAGEIVYITVTKHNFRPFEGTATAE